MTTARHKRDYLSLGLIFCKILNLRYHHLSIDFSLKEKYSFCTVLFPLLNKIQNLILTSSICGACFSYFMYRCDFWSSLCNVQLQDMYCCFLWSSLFIICWSLLMPCSINSSSIVFAISLLSIPCPFATFSSVVFWNTCSRLLVSRYRKNDGLVMKINRFLDIDGSVLHHLLYYYDTSLLLPVISLKKWG